MTHEPAKRRSILQVRGDRLRRIADWVVVEEPLEIRVSGEPIAIIMRTPGSDIDLAAGFALTEGVVRSAVDLGTIRHCGEGPDEDQNSLDIRLAEGVTFDPESLRRNLMASAACGLCGKASLEALATQARPLRSGPSVRRKILASLPDRLLEAQVSFGRTGALHAAGLFSVDGSLIVCREDVGRHNAVDKVIGSCLLSNIPVDGAILMVSGRTSFEILQKSAVAGIPLVCAISGPTTLAIETAAAFNITLVNFLRGRGMNISAGAERLSDA